ncbi:MAG: hypothetical protein RL148_832 [Planctomycetota bacterium]|jgi:hypothetical protein
MVLNRPLLLAALGAVLPLASCYEEEDCGCYYEPVPELVTVLVEVYDPITNFVWEDVGVRVVSAWQEWSNATYTNPVVDYELTDQYGEAYFDSFDMALANVGFKEDAHGRAVVGPWEDIDDAVVTLEVYAPGFVPVLVNVPVSWDQPRVFVSVPFN